LAIRIGDELDAILTTIATAAVLATAAAPGRTQEIPNLNVDPVCRGIAKQASTVAQKGAADLAFFPMRPERTGDAAETRR
jgi:hypothetical protein